nr:MAG TPA: hypothetical protein [Caudoviricetes sp.]
MLIRSNLLLQTFFVTSRRWCSLHDDIRLII